MSEKKKGMRAAEEDAEHTSFVPRFIEHLFGAVERFINRISDIAEDRALTVINLVVSRLLLCLFLAIGIMFLLTGGVRVIDHIVQFPGIGQIILGSLTLLVTGIIWLATRRQ
jgi:hypothetical protein